MERGDNSLYDLSRTDQVPTKSVISFTKARPGAGAMASCFATYHASTMEKEGRWRNLGEFITHHRVTLMCIQGVRVNTISRPTMEGRFEDKGWAVFWGQDDWDIAERATCGIFIATDQKVNPARKKTIPDNIGEKRVLAVDVARNEQRPLMVVGVYLPAKETEGRAELAETVMYWDG